MDTNEMQFSKLLGTIGVQTTLADLNRTIANLRMKANKRSLTTQAAPAPSNEPADLTAELAELEAQVQALTEQFNHVSLQLDRYEDLADQQLPLLTATAEGAIYNYKTAVDAVANYGVEWFRGLLLSEDAKVSLASKLHDLISKYTSNDLDVIAAVARRDPYMISRIMSPYSE